MKFKAEYIAQTAEAKNTLVLSYWRTVDADTLNEGTKRARQYERKGYRMVKLEQIMGKE